MTWVRHGEARFVLQAWLATRLVFTIVAVGVVIATGRTFEQILTGWDVAHFLRIASDGYAAADSVAFFPGLPLLMRAGMAVGIPGHITGVLVAAAGSLAAALALLRMGGVWASVAWLMAPTGVFTAVGYTESPFAAFAFWAWERASAGRWGQAALLAAGASTFRVSGVFLVVGLAVLALTKREPDGLGWLVLPTLVTGGFFAYLRSRKGSWTVWFDAQARVWSRDFTWPWDAWSNTWAAAQPGRWPDHPEWEVVFAAEIVSVAVGVLVVLWALFGRRWAESVYVAVQVLAFATSHWFWSVVRAVLLWFPLFVGVGEFIERRTPTLAWRVVGGLAAILAVGVQVVWAVTYFTGMWAG